MRIDVAFLPRDADPEILKTRAAVVFDVLRATTSMTAALVAGVEEIQIFANVASVRKSAGEIGLYPKPLLCGEENCLPPEGFDLGNSPGAFDRSLKGRTLFMSTTNGTKAIIAARTAKLLLVGALVNASAVAGAVIESGLDVTLICAGTNGEMAIEDAIGAGAVIEALRQSSGQALARSGQAMEESDGARMALRLFQSAKNDLKGALSCGAGGRNVLRAGLSQDIDFAASLDRFGKVVGRVENRVVRRLQRLDMLGKPSR